MKKVLLTAMVVAVATLQSCGQNVPEKVKSGFSQKFPNASSVKWDKESDTEWEAEFKMNGKDYSANFTIDGKWKETEYEIKKSEIPQAVKDAASRDYSGYDIEAAEKTETPEYDAYELELEKGEEVVEIVYSADGKVIKKKEKHEEGEEDDDED